MIKYNSELKRIQDQYLSMLKSFESDIDNEDFYYHAVSLIDKCEFFWMSKRLETIAILNESSTEQWFLLSGAVFLDIPGNGQYEFGTFGDRNIIDDPVVKMRSFFANGSNSISFRLKSYFTNAVNDTITVLEKYSEYFIVISLHILMSSERDECITLGEKIYWDTISNVLNRDIRSLDVLRKEFPTIDLLEISLGKTANQFIFNDKDDCELSLAERVKKWFAANNQIIDLEVSDAICQFFIASMAQMQQAFGILLACLQFDLYPFIRFEIPLHYFMLIADAFSDDDALKSKVEYALISFLYANYVIHEYIDNTDSLEFIKKCKEKRISKSLYQAVYSSGESSYSSLDYGKAIQTMRHIFLHEIHCAV